MERANVGGRELVRVELRADGSEEDADALPLQSCQARFVVTLARARSVVRDFGSEAGEDRLLAALDSVFGEHVHQFRNGIGERDECAVRVQCDRVEICELHATHCQRAHCTTATPRNNPLQATTTVCSRGLVAVTAARARKSGKMTSPKRGRDNSGQRELG